MLNNILDIYIGFISTVTAVLHLHMKGVLLQIDRLERHSFEHLMCPGM